MVLHCIDGIAVHNCTSQLTYCISKTNCLSSPSFRRDWRPSKLVCLLGKLYFAKYVSFPSRFSLSRLSSLCHSFSLFLLFFSSLISLNRFLFLSTSLYFFLLTSLSFCLSIFSFSSFSPFLHIVARSSLSHSLPLLYLCLSVSVSRSLCLSPSCPHTSTKEVFYLHHRFHPSP